MTYQIGITSLGTSNHGYFELNLRGSDPRNSLSTIINAINLPTTSGVNIVIGIRPELWAEVTGTHTDIHGFNEPIIGSDGYTLPATQTDIWLWIAASTRSGVFDCAKFLFNKFGDSAELIRETIGWVYENNRDLTGFEDGTENPSILKAPSVVSNAEGDSILLFQHWKHLSTKWENLPQEEQEKAIGRTKPDSIELEGDNMPETSHVSRSTVRVDGVSQEIFRRNVAYGDLSEHGTIFVGFSQDQWRMEEMLRRMAGVDGVRDTLTYFTSATTGGWYICPSVEKLIAFIN